MGVYIVSLIVIGFLTLRQKPPCISLMPVVFPFCSTQTNQVKMHLHLIYTYFDLPVILLFDFFLLVIVNVSSLLDCYSLSCSRYMFPLLNCRINVFS